LPAPLKKIKQDKNLPQSQEQKNTSQIQKETPSAENESIINYGESPTVEKRKRERIFRFPDEVAKIIDDVCGGWRRDYLYYLAKASFELAEVFHRGENFPLNLETVFPYTFYFFPKTFSSSFTIFRSLRDVIKKILDGKDEVVFYDISAGTCSASVAFAETLKEIYFADEQNHKNQIHERKDDGKDKSKHKKAKENKKKKIKFFVQDISDAALEIGIRILNQSLENFPFDFEVKKIVSDASRLKIKQDNPDIAVISYSLYDIFREDVEYMIVWVKGVLKSISPHGILIIVEPSLKKRGSLFIMKIRDALSDYVVAPCPLVNFCPMLKRGDDWCHFGVRWVPPFSLTRAINLIGGRPPDINFSYLVLSQSRDEYFNLPPKDIGRVVSHRLEEKGRIRFWLCKDGEKQLFQFVKKNISDENKDVFYVHSGDLVLVQSYEKKENFFEIKKDTRFSIIHKLFDFDF
jgi:hypothetical protein